MTPQPPAPVRTNGLRSSLILALDAVAIASAFYLGYLIRFEGSIPPEFHAQFTRYLLLLLAIRLPLHFAFRLHRWSYRLSGLHEATRVILTCAAGSAVFVTIGYFLQRGGPPRSVVAIELLLTTSLLGALRFSPRVTRHWYARRRSRGNGHLRTLIVGAGNSGELLARELERSDRHRYEVVGFVDDDPAALGAWIGGARVLGDLRSLPQIAERKGIEAVLLAAPGLPAASLRRLLSDCAELELHYRIVATARGHADRPTGTVLKELAPEDLLNRAPVSFEVEHMRELLGGRSILVTGAAGSIGSEICRQVARYAPRRLVMLDLDENEPYLLLRSLEAQQPELEVHVEVADIRDEGRIARLLERHRIQDVFHAAAHKHVPLMETCPEQAVLNNVGGCRVLGTAAAASGVERFVLISTDKAVEPTSVMGASKRIAELVVADLASRSRTRFTAVRFGNVLGSAGSVVPLFREQITRGGPVTVTDPDCRRYLMTPSEAVGLVLVAGLSGLGDLCILEMGEPIRILDLARLMITMSGQVPGRDVEIEFTGLRAGEKLEERLMSPAEESRSRVVADGIRALDVDPPVTETMAAIAELERTARSGERAAVIATMCRVLQDYAPATRWKADATAVEVLG